MNKHFNKISAGKSGFTLIELLIVILIIAILAATVLISMQGYIKKSKDASSKSEIQSLIINAAAVANMSASGSYSSFVCTTSSPWTDISQRDSNAVCGFNTTGTNFCACFKELSPSSNTYYCQDSTGVIIEQTTTNCANECEYSSTALCGQS